eukprot:11660540-Alexandrium_andersonii.AAC.1
MKLVNNVQANEEVSPTFLRETLLGLMEGSQKLHLAIYMFKHLADGDPKKSYESLLDSLRWQIGQERLAANRRRSAQ